MSEQPETYMTDELRRSYAGLQGLAVVAIGLH